ncbi:hypothetical protein [Tahibacter caeni]|uniref:hypothetical protein n=1 Tax=Tahibacter caeni TaxID=1453545 RepID=UPI0021482373|nr:hypothetical protein [Tahibacter caeni]
MHGRLSALFLLAAGSGAAAACPPAPSAAQLQSVDAVEDAAPYLLMRWLKCGPADAAALWPAWRDALHREEAEERADNPAYHEPDQAPLLLLTALSMDPDALAASIAESTAQAQSEQDDADESNAADEAVPGLRVLSAWPVPVATMKRHFEDGLEPAAALLRQDYPSPAIAATVELARVSQMIRNGRIPDARALLARTREAVPADDPEQIFHEMSQLLAEVLTEPEQRSLAESGPGLVLDRSTRTRHVLKCGFAGLEHLFGKDRLRAQVLRTADADAAIADQIEEHWRNGVLGRKTDDDANDVALLAELLRKRYGTAELRQAWDDAIALIRNDEQVAGTRLFGHFLALPSDVIEDAADAPDGTRQRKLGTQELAELVRGTPLYRATYGGG